MELLSLTSSQCCSPESFVFVGVAPVCNHQAFQEYLKAFPELSWFTEKLFQPEKTQYQNLAHLKKPSTPASLSAYLNQKDSHNLTCSVNQSILEEYTFSPYISGLPLRGIGVMPCSEALSLLEQVNGLYYQPPCFVPQKYK